MKLTADVIMQVMLSIGSKTMPKEPFTVKQYDTDTVVLHGRQASITIIICNEWYRLQFVPFGGKIEEVVTHEIVSVFDLWGVFGYYLQRLELLS